MASPEVPTERLMHELKTFWPHGIRFHLLGPRAFREMVEEFLPPLPASSMSSILTGLGVLASFLAITRTWGRVPVARVESNR